MTNIHTKHRHWVLIPVALAFVALYSFQLQIPITAQLQVQQVVEGVTMLPVSTTSTHHVYVVNEGNHTLYAPGESTVAVAGYSVSLLNGMVFTSVHNSKVTVAAITSPALVQDEAGTSILIPVGYQWSSANSLLPSVTVPLVQQLQARVLTRVPTSFLQEDRKKVQEFTQQLLPTTQRLFSVVEPLLLTKRAKQEELLHTIDSYLLTLQQAIETRDTVKEAQVRTLVSSHTSNPHVAAKILVWLDATPSIPEAIRLEFIESIIVGSPTRLALLGMHPIYADAIWAVLQPEELQGNTQLLLRYPQFYLQHGGSAIAVQQWSVATKIVLQQQGIAVAEAMVFMLNSVLTESAFTMHPFRTRQLLTVSLDLLRPYTQDLNAMDQITYAALAKQARTQLPEVAVQQPDEISIDDTYLGILRSEEIEVLATDILREAGAVYSVNTQFQTIDDYNAIRVQDIIFSDGDRDRIFTFDLQVKTGQVYNIIEGQQVYPNPMWIEDFVAWLQ